MPATPPAPTPTRAVSRRGFLGGTGGLLLAAALPGCTGGSGGSDGKGDDGRRTPAAPDRDETGLRAALAVVEPLAALAGAAAAGAGLPAAARERLTVAARAHATQVEVLEAALPPPPASTASASAVPPTTVPAAGLVEARERAAAGALAVLAARAGARSTALLGSLAAGCAALGAVGGPAAGPASPLPTGPPVPTAPPVPTGSPVIGGGATGAAQTALAAEHAAIYGYGLAGVRLPVAGRRAARAREAEHRSRRDDLEAALASAGATPTPAAPAYRPPAPVTTAAAARRLLAAVEEDVTASSLSLAAAVEGSARVAAVQAAVRSAVAAVGWGAPPSAFPGLRPPPAP